MKFLHLLRSEPTSIVKLLAAELGGPQIALYQGAVDYDRRVAEIFAADRVVCWW